MSITIKNFAGIRGAPEAPQLLVDRTGSTQLAFIAHEWGCRGSETTLIKQGVAEGAEVVTAALVPGGTYPIAVEVYASGHGQFSINDGTSWQGPFEVEADEPMGMLVRFTPGADPQQVNVRFKADQACSKVLIQARSCPSPAQMAVI